MPRPSSLASTRSIFVGPAGKEIARYHLRLATHDGGALAVNLPARLTKAWALEAAHQLRELAQAIGDAARLAVDPPSREQLLNTSEQLRSAHGTSTDYESAQDLLGYYAVFRSDVLEHLRAVPLRR